MSTNVGAHLSNGKDSSSATVNIERGGEAPVAVVGVDHDVDHILNGLIRAQLSPINHVDGVGKDRGTGRKYSPALVCRIRQLLVLGCTPMQINAILRRESYITENDVVNPNSIYYHSRSEEVKEAAKLWRQITFMTGFCEHFRQLELLNRIVEENVALLFPDEYAHLQPPGLPKAPILKAADRVLIARQIIQTIDAINAILQILGPLEVPAESAKAEAIAPRFALGSSISGIVAALRNIAESARREVGQQSTVADQSAE